MDQRREFLKKAAKLGTAGGMAAMAAAAATGPATRAKVAGGIRLGNLYFSSGLTGVRDEARKDPLAFGGDIKEQTKKILELHKANLESMGSSLENVLKVTVFLADVKTEKNAMNEVYGRFFPKDAPARSAFGIQFPDTATRVEIELVAWIPKAMPKKSLPHIGESTKRYETWLAAHIPLIRGDLELKHAQMKALLFPFFRATYYRWAEVWPQVCSEMASAPEALSVGDLHVENFGTWRDTDGRLIWGVNDFDEASWLPYTNDLVRLVASANVAIDANHIALDRKTACYTVLEGYQKCLAAGGRPFVLAEDHPALGEMARHRLKEPEKFWAKLDTLPPIKGKVPNSAKKAIARMLPQPDVPHIFVHRVAGLGSLGRERYVGIAMWHGGKIAREAKALVPSACVFAKSGKITNRILYQQILDKAIRCPDPWVRLRGRWIVRRLAPDCSRIELSALPMQRDEIKLLQAMGYETANIHLGTAKARDIQKDLKKRPAGWLYNAARQMVDAVTADWERWRKL